MKALNMPVLGKAVPEWGNKLSRALGRGFLTLSGWRFEGELPDLPKFLIVVAPHTSNWDFVYGIAALLGLGMRAHWLGKHTLFRKPFGGFMKWLGGIPVDRSQSHGVVEDTVAEFSQRPHFVLGVAPEGTRKKVQKWKTGFYYIAKEANVPILTGFIDYARKVVGFGPTIYPSGDIDSDLATIQSFYALIGGKHPSKA
ncbi:MAG: lysophospholipid acyltransferase family protein [bacterium]